MSQKASAARLPPGRVLSPRSQEVAGYSCADLVPLTGCACNTGLPATKLSMAPLLPWLPKVRDDIMSTLRMRSPRTFQVSFFRPNLHFHVVEARAQRAARSASCCAAPCDALPGVGSALPFGQPRCCAARSWPCAERLWPQPGVGPASLPGGHAAVHTVGPESQGKAWAACVWNLHWPAVLTHLPGAHAPMMPAVDPLGAPPFN